MDYLVTIDGIDILIEKHSVENVTDGVVDRLHAYRKELGLTQQDIADALGMKLNISLEKKEEAEMNNEAR